MKSEFFGKGLGRIFLNGFIVFHLVAAASWSMPFETLRPTQFVSVITPYMLGRGLWQSWDMFAPNPNHLNAHLEALITFRDGKQESWVFPRMDKMGYFDRYVNERYRKWSLDRVRLDAYS